MKVHFTKKIFALLAAIFLSGTFAAAQNRTITGTVVDESNNPVPGASVILDGTTRGTATLGDGTFTLPNMPASGTLTVSMMGYTDQVISLTGSTTYRITLTEDTQFLDEIVVVGYGVMRKSDVTGAVLSVSEAQLQDRPVSNPFEALQGKAAGVDITSATRPGQLGSIRIRGQRSITGSSNPLYVVDGVPLQGSTDISMINTYDIKSIDILKDASATAIYGSRGANGVILITTQKGESGTFRINYNGSVTLQNDVDYAERFNATEWMDLVRWANYYADPVTYPQGHQPTQATDYLMFGSDAYAWERNVMKGWESGTWDPSKVQTTDWPSLVTRTGIIQNHQLSTSGGTDRMNLYASFGYLNDTGTSYGQSYERYTVNLNGKVTPKSWFEMGVNMNTSWQIQEYGQDGTGAASASGAGSIYDSALRLYPYTLPFYYDWQGQEDGARVTRPGNDDQLKTPIDEWKYTRNQRKTANVFANMYAQLNLMEGLSYKFSFGPSLRYRREGLFVSPESAVRTDMRQLARVNNNLQFAWTIENMVNYNKSFGKHSLGVTLVQTAEKYKRENDQISGEGAIIESALWNNMSLFQKSEITATSGLEDTSMTSYMGRLNYTYNDKYILTATGRYDGSSVLAKGHKWSFFPSVALAWRMEQEDFIENISWINQLKLRVGYGITGNAAVGPYSTIGDINTALYPYNGSDATRYYFVNDLLASSTRQTLPNFDLGWEKTHQFNVGIDFSLFRTRLSGTIDYYTSKTTDLLLSASIPSLTGYLSTTGNLGETRNNGVDITLNTINVKAGDFTWTSSLNVAYARNKIVELANGKEDDVANTRFIGHPIGVMYGYEVAGLWHEDDIEEMNKFNSRTNPDGSPKTAMNFKIGQTRPVDQNGDYVINTNDDRVIIGYTNPAWTGGMSHTFSYKGFELSMLLYGRAGYWTSGGNVQTGARYMFRKVDYYTEINKDAEYQRPERVAAGGEQDTFANLLGRSKASFVNIRNISLGYVFPRDMVQKWGMQNLRVYAQIINPGALYQSVKWKNMDTNSSLGNRNYVFGLNIGF